jgi:hypothetical protein
MKVPTIVRMVLATLVGVLFGVLAAQDYEKWHSRGREAFLSHESERFDVYMASPSAGASIRTGASAIAVVALYEGAVVLVLKLVSRST